MNFVMKLVTNKAQSLEEVLKDFFVSQFAPKPAFADQLKSQVLAEFRKQHA